MFRFVALGFLLMSSAGCVYSLGITAQKDLSFQLDRAAPIYLSLPNDVNIDEGNAYKLLRDTLAGAGFMVADDMADAKFVMTCDISSASQRYESYPVSPAFGFYGRRGWGYGYWGNPFWGSWYYDRPYEYAYEQKFVKLRLFDAAVFAAGKSIPVWEGSIYGMSDAFENKMPESLKALVEQIGNNYKGRVSIKASN